MIASVNPAAGTQSIQSSAISQKTQLTTGHAPTSAPTAARSRAQTNVDKLFQLTAGLSAELSGTIDGAEATRVQGGEGVESTQVVQSLSEIKEKVDAMRARAPTLSRFTDKLAAELDQAVKTGRGSNARIAEVVQQAQKEMAERYGYVGHILNTTA
jgi:phage shock protein A